jgi:hypothetical protein
MEDQTERRLQVMGRRRRRHRQLLDGLKEMGGYYNLKEEALDRHLGELILEEAVEVL